MKPFRFFRDFGIELLAAHLIFLLIFSGCVSLQQQEQTVGIHYTETVNTETVFDSASRMQVDRIFPIPLEIYDEGILPNNYISFVAYKEQAKLYFLAIPTILRVHCSQNKYSRLNLLCFSYRYAGLF
mgnify:CR=1 FL=1